MKDRFVVRNNSGNVLMLPKNRITLAVGGVIDLAERLDKTIAEIKRDQEINIELAHNNLIKIEEFDSTQSDIEGKLDTLLAIMNKRGEEPQNSFPSNLNIDINSEKIESIIREEIQKVAKGKKDIEADIESEEDRMREEAMKKIIEQKKSKESNLSSFGGEEKESDSDDDLIDLIDF